MRAARGGIRPDDRALQRPGEAVPGVRHRPSVRRRRPHRGREDRAVDRRRRHVRHRAIRRQSTRIGISVAVDHPWRWYVAEATRICRDAADPSVTIDRVDLLADLDARGLIHDSTDRDALAKRLADGPIGVYVGFDPSGDSLHAGNLIGQITLRRFQLAGHNPIVLAGGATGMIGDPSGVSEERNLLDPETLAKNLEGITVQLEKLLDFSPGPHQARLVNNYTWTSQWGLLDFLRDTGKHVTVNQMVARESVRARMESDTGISFTEFTYQLLQAADFCWLYEHEQCEMQMGGSDQWGNIVTGIDLIRKRVGGTAFGLTWPLLLKADGAKFGKSAGGAVWLDPGRTTPYQFRQFFVQVDDADVERQLLWFTLLPVSGDRRGDGGPPRGARAAAGPAALGRDGDGDGPRRRRRPSGRRRCRGALRR